MTQEPSLYDYDVMSPAGPSRTVLRHERHDAAPVPTAAAVPTDAAPTRDRTTSSR